MPDGANLALLIRGAVSVLLAFGGIISLYQGVRLLRRTSPMTSHTNFEATLGPHRVAFSAGAAGTAVVLSSTVWVLGTITALPSFTQSPEGTRVAATTLVTVPFEGASTNVSPEQRAALDSVADRLKQAATSNEIILESHATGGSEKANLAVAERRAQGIREYLAREHGIPSEKIEIVSQGEERPRIGTYRNAVAVITRGYSPDT